MSRLKVDPSIAADPDGVLSPAAILDAQGEIIDAIASGTELHATLNTVALIIERLTPPAICTIHLLDPDGLHLRQGGAPSLPDSYNRVIDGAEIGPFAGSCGTAAFLRRLVIVEDIDSDPLWDDYRAYAAPLGLRACWSQPIFDDAGTVLGTFALYYRQAKSPDPVELELVDRMARLVRVALVQDRREKALIETDQKLRDYLAVSSDWLWEQDAEAQLTFASSNGVRVDAGSLGGKSPMNMTPHGMTAVEVEAYRADLQAGRPFRNLRVEQMGRTGELHYLNVSGMPIHDANGQFRGYRGTAHDVTKQVAAEEESLRARVEAQDANRAKTEFLANISHELRTPLNAILGFSEIMEGALLGPLSDRYRQYAADIHQSGQYLHGLVTNILDLSRIEMGRVQLEEEVVRISELIDSSVNMLRMRADEEAVRLKADPLPDLPPVRCDRLRLQQALINLVTNAVKFTPKYGQVTVSARLTEDGIALSVADTGIGMRPEDIPRSLEAFRQIEPQLSRRHDGVGLGLALTKSLVELHGGHLELTSVLGEGTTATIHLPAERIVA